MAKVEQKKTIVEEITNHVKDAQCVVLVNYSGLTVEQDTILRKEFREAGIVYKVYKNTMMNFAFKGTSCESLTEHLHGTNALAISADDATAPARILSKYAKQYPALEMIAGVVEGNYNDQAGMQALASIPSREELLGKLLGSIQSPISNLPRTQPGCGSRRCRGCYGGKTCRGSSGSRIDIRSIILGGKNKWLS